MPELPEAETITRGLRERVLGASITRAYVLRPDVLRQPAVEFRARVKGRCIGRIWRRGKNIVMALDDEWVLAVNLGMTGRLLPFTKPPVGPKRPSHPAVRFALGGGGVLFYDDVRRFGTVEALEPGVWRDRSRAMGPEPLSSSYGPGNLHRDCVRRRTPIRSWLLDQKRIAGVGNIYANEALFLAGIRPTRQACSLSADEAAALHGSLRRILTLAIEEGGTTLRDYRDASGGEGSFGRHLFVYGRARKPCRSCGSIVQRVVIANRSAFLCPGCQPEP